MPTVEQIDAELQRREQLKEIEQEMQRRGISPEEGEAVTPGQFVKGEFGTAAQIGRGTVEQLRDQLLKMIPKMPKIPATREMPAAPAITPERPTFPEAAPTAPTEIGRALGDILGFAGAGAAGGAARAALPAAEEAGPVAARLLRAIRGAPGRMAGTALYGEAVSPDRLKGLEMGGGLGTLAEALPLPFKGAAYLSKYLKPSTVANSIMSYLGGGEGIEENGINFAKLLRNTFQRKTDEATDLYNPVKEAAGKTSIYTNKVNSPEFYKNMFDPVTQKPEDVGIYDDYNRALKKMHNDFIENPTFEKAHDLQSQLGYEARQIEKQPVKPRADINTMDNFNAARDNLRNDMAHFLDYKDASGGLSDAYQDATEAYKQENVPYLINSGIAKIAKGKITNPKNLTTLFKYPDEDITKVVNDMGPEANRRLLYNELGKLDKATPEKLLSAYNKLDKQGLASYITPELKDGIDKMSQKMLPIPAEIIRKTPVVGPVISPIAKVPVAAAETAARGITAAYPWLSRAAIATLLGGQ